jgi:hypothetical protein
LSAAQSEGCHAVVKQRRAVFQHFLSALQGYGLAGQPSPLKIAGRLFNKMKDFCYVYILVSELDARRHYSGVTRYLQPRLEEQSREMPAHIEAPTMEN